ncbi:C-C chemokine receptor type 5-like [Sinocyclocheilus anshuiensis]|uniref:C-C chemokine receptor type 5-like n=1 Tax=Sinocyclocheilus anshuiensis TaxID=1608454 RepID=UPI0007B90B12|nr:PREDICTED: C-C chemokine receptor type 5-like [Sinocyclocheilus anshuiensis]
MTEEPGTAAAPTADYSDYYDLHDETGSVCADVNTPAFSGLLFPVLYSTVFTVGLLGNALVLWVLIRHRHRSSLTDVCLLNLAVSDLFSLASLPVWAHSAVDKWVFGSFVCHTVTGLFMTGLYGRVFFMVLMTLDRYVIIVYKHSICSRKRPAQMALVLFVWMLSLFVSLPDIVFAKVRESIKASCGSEFPEAAAWMSFTYLNVLSLILPLIITSFCFCRILSVQSEENHSIVRLLLAVPAVYFFFWTPYNIVTFLVFLQTKGYMFSCEWFNGLALAMQWVKAMALIHCCLNPIIYTCAGQKCRRAVLTVLKEQLPSCFSQYITCSPQSPESGSSECSSTLIA